MPSADYIFTAPRMLSCKVPPRFELKAGIDTCRTPGAPAWPAAPPPPPGTPLHASIWRAPHPRRRTPPHGDSRTHGTQSLPFPPNIVTFPATQHARALHGEGTAMIISHAVFCALCAARTCTHARGRPPHAAQMVGSLFMGILFVLVLPVLLVTSKYHACFPGAEPRCAIYTTENNPQIR